MSAPSTKTSSFTLALVVAAAAGFLGLSYEILWYRVIAFVSWGAPGAFGLLLAAYLLGIAVGSRVAGVYCKEGDTGKPEKLRSLATFTFAANLVAYVVVPTFTYGSKLVPWPVPLVAVAIAAALMGAVLPLVAHFGIAPDDRAGQSLSYVYLANIIGSTAGSLVTGFVFMDTLPIARIGLLLALLGVAVAVGIYVASRPPPRALRTKVLVAGAGAVGLVVCLGNRVVYDRPYERLLYKKSFVASTRFSEIIETKSGVITVTPEGTVFGGGAYDGKLNTSIASDRNGIVRAYSVGALHAAPKSVLMIGLASGSWAQVVANLPGVESFTIVEINPGYLQLVANHPEVSSLLTNPKVHVVTDDGRRWLLRHPQARFDVVVQNTTWHWRAHITNLLSAEYMDLVRARLAKGGIFFFNTTWSEDVRKTAALAFPYALRVQNFMAVSDEPFTFDRGRWENTLTNLSIDGKPVLDRSTPEGARLFAELAAWSDTLKGPPVDHGLESRESVLARLSPKAKIVTDDNMAPEWKQIFRFPGPP